MTARSRDYGKTLLLWTFTHADGGSMLSNLEVACVMMHALGGPVIWVSHTCRSQENFPRHFMIRVTSLSPGTRDSSASKITVSHARSSFLPGS